VHTRRGETRYRPKRGGRDSEKGAGLEREDQKRTSAGIQPELQHFSDENYYFSRPQDKSHPGSDTA
jgi:hypothetical protein